MKRFNPFQHIHTSSKRFNATYGFIGLGAMGAGMANNLITKTKPLGANVLVYDTYRPSLDQALINGAVGVSRPSEMSSVCDFIITMLATESQINSVYDDILSKPLKDNSLLIDCSTVNYLTSKHLATLIPNNSSIIDSPVSGGSGAAQSGTLTFMVGGKQSSYERAKNEVLCYMGLKDNVFHAGDAHGSGQIAKICNNLILAICMDAVSEGMILGTKLGMEPQKLADIVNKSTGRCWSSDTYNPSPGVTLYDAKTNEPKSLPSGNNYEGGFRVDLMRKDLGLALNAAKTVNANTPLGAAIAQFYDMISNRGFGGNDFSFLYQFIKGSEIDLKDENTKSYGP